MAYQPKSYKKFVATAATATLVATAVVPAAFANEAETAAFSDVPKSYEAAIDFVVSNNISKGLTETKYGIDAQIKRGDVAIIIANAAGLNNKDAKASGFKDVPTRGTLAVNSLKAAGIVDGKSTTNFGFADPITRGEAAIMIQRAFKITGDVKDVKFTDVSDRYDDAVAALLAYKVTQGTSTTKFGTQDPIKRGDFAKFIYALKDLVVLPTTDPAVTALNAKQIELNFGKAVNPSTVLDSDGTLKNGVLSLATISGTAATLSDSSVASLSEDGKTLTVTTATGTLNGEYVLKTGEDTVKDTAGSFLPVYTSNVFSASDTVAPTVKSVVKVDATKVRVNFSEPLSSAGNWTFKFADGTSAAVSPNTSNLAKGYVDLTIDGGVTAGKEITATIVGAADFANNLISPNPVTLNFSKGAVDGTKPTVTSLTPTSLSKFEIKFSEEIQGFTGSDVVINGSALNDITANNATSLEAGEAKVTVDATDKTKYTVELGTELTGGLNTVGLSVNAVSDLSGETSAAFSRVVDFKVDKTAPKLVSSQVKTDAGTEYLYLTFDESVDMGTLTALPATQVKNYVTVNGTINLSDLGVVANTDDKQYRVALNSVNTKFTPANGSASAIVDSATYTVDLTGAFDDKSNNLLETATATFTRGSDTDTTKPSVVKTVDSGETSPLVANNGIKVVNNNTFQVTFDKALDGASATNKANYSVNGASVQSVTLLPNNVVEVKLEEGNITLEGLRNVSISGVKSTAGILMNTYTTSEYFVENVRPAVSSASLISQNKVKVVFSEPVDVSKVSAADLDVFVGTTKEVETGLFSVTAEAVSPGSYETSFIITLADALTPAEYAQTLTVQVVNDATPASIITDAKGNKVVTGVYSIAK